MEVSLTMDCRYLIFYACLRLQLKDVETNPSPRRPVPAVCRILCSNVQGLARNLGDLTMALSQYEILLCRSKMPWEQGMAAYEQDDYGAFL